MNDNQKSGSDQLAAEEEVGSKGSLAATHAAWAVLPAHVAPALAGRGKNTLRMELLPVACLRIHGDCFAFGSSFILPESQKEFHALARLRTAHPAAPLSIFGHADPVGGDATNKRLSGHRAESVYAVLLQDPSRWEKLYVSSGQSEGWGTNAIQTMLGALGYAGATKAAIEEFQRRNSLTVDGSAGPRTRDKLFRAYMNFLSPSKLETSDFLAGGKDSGAKGDVQGCGEFNPVMIFGQAELEELEKRENKERRDSENGVNRRVVILLFRPGTVIPPEKWPCPRTTDGDGDCRKRFWSDSSARRNATEERRTFGKSRDTFSCRFYQRLVNDSPCELRDGKARLTDRMTISFVLASASQASAEFPKFLLSSTDGGYSKELSPKNDLVPGDQYLQLRFEHLLPGRQYKLRREDSPSIAETVFDDIPFELIVDQERDSNSSLEDHDFALAELSLSESFSFDWTA